MPASTPVSTAGDFGGTGIVIQVDDKTKYISVENIVPDGPADKAGVEQDDLITTIDGLSTKGMSLPQASGKLRGKEGTRVTLTLSRDGAALTAPITITRAKIHQLSVYEKMLPNKIGYVALTVFGKETGNELAAALDRLQQQGARAIVLDLRDNGGGYLEAAVAVSSKFIPSGPIVSVESRASNITTLDADNTAIAPLPLAVLVNGYTASASEITSGAIQDSSVGAIVGTKTFGKGRRADDLSAARWERGQSNDGALSHAAQSRHQPSRHHARHRHLREQASAVRNAGEGRPAHARDPISRRPARARDARERRLTPQR